MSSMEKNSSNRLSFILFSRKHHRQSDCAVRPSGGSSASLKSVIGFRKPRRHSVTELAAQSTNVMTALHHHNLGTKEDKLVNNHISESKLESNILKCGVSSTCRRTSSSPSSAMSSAHPNPTHTDSSSTQLLATNNSPTSNSSKTGTTSPKPSATVQSKSPSDFKFGKILGDGSYSTVCLGKEISTGHDYAIKIVEKRHILREKKRHFVMREREILSKINHPFFVKLYFTFQDRDKLYFGLSYAKRGELLPYIRRLGSFDEPCTQFYSAEIVIALEYLHSHGIIHRDLKPENILLGENMHIQITDFGTAKILTTNNTESKANSFVGTAQYVSPELLTEKSASKSSDLWALGCIVYQLLSGLPPFRAANEYQIFQKIIKLQYEFPEGFPTKGEELVRKLLVLSPKLRLGHDGGGGYPALKAHPFFDGINWDNLPDETPPKLMPYLPANSPNAEELRSDFEYPLSSDDDDDDFYDSTQIAQMYGLGNFGNLEIAQKNSYNEKMCSMRGLPTMPYDEFRDRLEKQRTESQWHRFVEDNLIIYNGLIDKRKGLFARRRMLLLTSGPHLYYVDPVNMVLKGEIPWTPEIRTEAKNFKTFFVHTPHRTYYLEDPEGYSLVWCREIERVHARVYPETRKT